MGYGAWTANPVVNMLFQGGMGLLTQALVGKPPAPPSYANRVSGAQTFGTPQGTGPALPPGSQRFTGLPGGARLPNPEDMTLTDLLAASVNDAHLRAKQQEASNARLMPQIDAYGQALDETTGMVRGAAGRIPGAWKAGEQGFVDASRAVGAAGQVAESAAAYTARQADAKVKQFFQTAAHATAGMQQLRGEVMGAARSQAATLLADASQSVSDSTRMQMSEMEAGMRAAGVPEGQIQSELAQISAMGQQKVGDMLREIGSAENTRLSNLATTTGQWISDIRNATLTTGGAVLAQASGDIAGAMNNLAQTKATLASTEAYIADSASKWRASMIGMEGDLAALMGKLALGGRVDMVNMLSMIQDPIIELAPILESTFSDSVGLEQLDWENALTSYDVNAQWIDIPLARISSAWSYGQQREQYRSNRRWVEGQNEQATVANLGGALIGAGGNVAGGYLSSQAAGGLGGGRYGFPGGP